MERSAPLSAPTCEGSSGRFPLCGSTWTACTRCIHRGRKWAVHAISEEPGIAKSLAAFRRITIRRRASRCFNPRRCFHLSNLHSNETAHPTIMQIRMHDVLTVRVAA